MTPIKATELHLFKGRTVRVVYVIDRGVQPSTMINIVDNLITDPVLLQEYDSQTKKVTVQRANGKVETLSPYQVFAAD